MFKRSVWYVLLAVLCCGVVLMAVSGQAINDTLKKAKNPQTGVSPRVTKGLVTIPETAQPVQHQVNNGASTGNVDPAVVAGQAALARVQRTGVKSPADAALIDAYFAATRSVRPDRGNSLDDQGGPDTYGYRFVDNLGSPPDTATYNWIELRGDAGATLISSWPNGYDDGCAGAAAPIGFSFSLYGTSYTTFTPTSNGQIEFGTCYPYNYTACMPYASWGPAIMPYMQDLHLQNGGDPTGNNVVAYKNFGTYTVIEYDSAGYWSSTYAGSSLKFEAILYSNGYIKLQYNTTTLAGSPPMGTVGIQNAAGTTFLQYRCYSDGNTVRPLTSGRAVWFYPGPPPAHDFSTSAIDNPLSGGIYPAGTSLPVTATFMNMGTNTDASPINYSFNGGATVTEASGNVVAGGTVTHTFTPQITMPAAPGAYVLTVWTSLATDGNHNNDTLRITVNTPCALACQTGDVIECVENPADPTFGYTDCDGGCNNIFSTSFPSCPTGTPTYGAINCGQTVCGTAFTYTGQTCTGTPPAQIRDTDWYLFTIAQSETVTVSLTSQFPALFGIVSGASPCATPTFVASLTTVANCLTPTVLTAPCLAPGTYALFVAPNMFVGMPAPLSYRATLNCATSPCIPPPNDNCANATPVIVNGPAVTGNNSFATVDCPALGAPEAWITFTTTQCQDITVSYCGSPFTFYTVFIWLMDACPCGANHVVASSYAWNCSVYNPTVTFAGLPAGTWYYPLYSAAGYQGAYQIAVTGVPCPTGRCCYNNGASCVVNTSPACTALSGIWTSGLDCNTACPIPPANDQCVNATHLTGPVTALPFDNTLAGPTADNSSCAMGHDLWYCWTTTCEVDVNVNLCGSGFDTKLAVFTTDANCTCPAPTAAPIVCNDDTCGLQSAVSFHATAGKYLIQVGGFSTVVGTGIMNIITSAPCACGDSATAVTATLDTTANHHVWLHFNAPSTVGRYQVYATANHNPGSDVHNGNWTNIGTVIPAVVGTQVFTDTSALGSYKNYEVVHDCALIGRCCYNNFTSCAVNSNAECTVLNGTWTSGLTCATPCPTGPTYCAATHTTGCDESIGNVTVGDINHTSDCGTSPYYYDFTAVSTHMTAGTGYPITVTNGGNPYTTDQVEVWVDWNGNGSFLDAGEAYPLVTNSTGSSFSGTITPPAGTPNGSYRMRIRLGYSWTPAPCGATSYGETEDFTVIIP